MSTHDGDPACIATEAPLPDTTLNVLQTFYHRLGNESARRILPRHESDCSLPTVEQNVVFQNYLVLGISEQLDEEMNLLQRQLHLGRVVNKTDNLVISEFLMARSNRLRNLFLSSPAHAEDDEHDSINLFADNNHSSLRYTPA